MTPHRPSPPRPRPATGSGATTAAPAPDRRHSPKGAPQVRGTSLLILDLHPDTPFQQTHPAPLEAFGRAPRRKP